MSQGELLILAPRFERGNTERPILYLVEMFLAKTLLIPEFQRARVWKELKKQEWIETILDHQAIGTLVTYQIKGEGPIFLADGLQRLTTTSEFLKNPSALSFDFGSEQARAHCMAFSIPVQHRHYGRHWDAMVAFQNLNKGTVLTPAEFHKGVLVLDSEIGGLLHREIPSVVDSLLRPFLTRRKSSRNTGSRMMRDSLGMFYQYVTKTDAITLWKVGHQQTTNQATVEFRIREYIEREKLAEKAANRLLSDFSAFVASELAYLREVMGKTNQVGKSFSPTSIRNLLHTAIWRRNTNRPRAEYESLVSALMDIWKNYNSFTSKFHVPVSDPPPGITLQMDCLSHTKRVCSMLGLGLFDVTRRKKSDTAIGYDSGHIKPFSLFGEGKTVPMPSGQQRALGAKEVTMES